ncbi:MAG TPA: high-potential iron-sulfur protein [Acetobacteraceae bacterium]
MNNNPTRRIMLRTGLGVAAGATLAASAARAQDEKIAQELVQYQDQPKDGQQCNKCAQYVDPNACKIVAGKISPQGYCVAYAPKEG